MTLPSFEDHLDPRVVSTGELPDPQAVQAVVDESYVRYRDLTDGTVADYIPALARVDASLFGVAVVGVAGRVFTAGDADHAFSIQSVSKPFVFALVCQAIGYREARERLGVNATGLPFNSVMAVELNDTRTMNPLVNAGAIATSSLLPGATEEEKWAGLLEGLSGFAGRPLVMNEEIYASEAATNQRNQGVAHLLHSYGRMYADPDDATDLYTRQCSLEVTARDLATMAATLADGGVNPLTGQRVIDVSLCPKVLSVLATSGLYERSGDWLFDIGLPGKSGVGGGIVTVAPGKGGIATFSPPLDEAGNSVRGQCATKFLADRLGVNLFASNPF